MERPLIFDLSRPEDRDRLAQIEEAGRVHRRHDAIRLQLDELVRTRARGRALEPAALEARALAILEGRPLDAYGRWVLYPWSGALVHVLPEDAFRELRSDRNRHKITDAEQARLSAARIGVVGLSVGSTSAVTLVLESIGTRFRLADFDALELSNMNRLRASVADLGVPKVELAARAMYEIDPYLDIELFDRGITEENAERFVVGDGDAPLSLLVEECDDLAVKVLLRERARAHGVPVLMETSDGGLLDVERFDLEPDRPVLHGLLHGHDAAGLRDLSKEAKIPLVMRVLDPAHVSPRAAASMVEIQESVSTWPQLASDIALGGALVGSTARRVLLGELEVSGRFRVDLHETIRPETATLRAPAPPPEPPLSAPRAPEASAAMEEIARLACLAPSAGNVQPWRLEVAGDRITCALATERRSTYLGDDDGDRLALGAALENAALASGALGLEVDVSSSADGWTLVTRPARATAHPWAAHIEARHTNRARGDGRPLSVAHGYALTQAAGEAAALSILTDREALLALGGAIGALERAQITSPTLSPRLLKEMRWTPAEALETRTGLDVDTLQLAPLERAGLTLLRDADAREALRRVDGGAKLERGNAETIAAAAGVALLSSRGDALQAGRALQRVWLCATALGIGVHPYGTPADLWARARAGRLDGLDGVARERVDEALETLAALWPMDDDARPLLVLRFAYAPPAPLRSLRLKAW